MNYEQLGSDIGKLVQAKNEAYGNSFSESGKIMRILYPNGIGIEQMDDALVIVRMIDKLFRIATSKDAFGESPFADLCGYSLLGLSKDTRKKLEPEQELEKEKRLSDGLRGIIGRYQSEAQNRQNS